MKYAIQGFSTFSDTLGRYRVVLYGGSVEKEFSNKAKWRQFICDEMISKFKFDRVPSSLKIINLDFTITSYIMIDSLNNVGASNEYENVFEMDAKNYVVSNGGNGTLSLNKIIKEAEFNVFKPRTSSVSARKVQLGKELFVEMIWWWVSMILIMSVVITNFYLNTYPNPITSTYYDSLFNIKNFNIIFVTLSSFAAFIVVFAIALTSYFLRKIAKTKLMNQENKWHHLNNVMKKLVRTTFVLIISLSFIIMFYLILLLVSTFQENFKFSGIAIAGVFSAVLLYFVTLYSLVKLLIRTKRISAYEKEFFMTFWNNVWTFEGYLKHLKNFKTKKMMIANDKLKEPLVFLPTYFFVDNKKFNSILVNRRLEKNHHKTDRHKKKAIGDLTDVEKKASWTSDEKEYNILIKKNSNSLKKWLKLRNENIGNHKRML
ncbi:MAG: hypothetical protein KAG14_00985 [Mycoplasmataceae bacterium]|nr:hypothetical protein [Mycoplasmataceae bacterium]